MVSTAWLREAYGNHVFPDRPRFAAYVSWRMPREARTYLMSENPAPSKTGIMPKRTKQNGSLAVNFMAASARADVS